MKNQTHKFKQSVIASAINRIISSKKLLASAMVCGSFTMNYAYADSIYGTSDGIGTTNYFSRGSSNMTLIVQSDNTNTYDDAFGGQGGGDCINNNTVKLYGGTFSNVYGGYFMGATGGEASNNTVLIDGASVTTSVVGGFAASTSGVASNNTVTVKSGTIGGTIRGTNAIGTKANNNTVSLYSTATFNNVDVYGFTYINVSLGTGTGNTLNIYSESGDTTPTLALNSVQRFNNYNFYLNNQTLVNSTTDAMLELANSVDFSGTNGTLIVGNNVSVAYGDKVTVVKVTGAGQSITGGFSTTARQGLSSAYTANFELSEDNTKYIVTFNEDTSAGDVSGGGASGGNLVQGRLVAETKSLLEGTVAASASLNNTADLIAGEVMCSAGSAAQSSLDGMSAFAVTGGDSSRFTTGSHVNVDSVALIAGLAKNIDLGIDALTSYIGGFMELGYGDYATYNDFSSGRVKGDGSTYNIGFGLLGHIEYQLNSSNAIYSEGSVRYGFMKNSWNSKDFFNVSTGENANYSIHTAYQGYHLGLGLIHKFTDRFDVDTNLKLFINHVEGETNVNVTGERWHFKSTDSVRLRAGARANYAVTDSMKLYAGAYLEKECDGSAHATVSNKDVASPSLHGYYGIYELGFTIQPDTVKGLDFSLGLQTYSGKREGISGVAKALYRF